MKVDPVRLRRERESNHLLAGGDHQVELDPHRLAQKSDVSLLDVAAIAPELDVDRGCPGLLRQERREHRIRTPGLPGLPEQRHGVQRDAELDHGASPIAALAASSTLFARDSISARSGPSIMMRSNGSVPE